MVEGGTVLNVGAAPSSGGTQITVHDLFANVPARRAFVRSLRSETGQIAQVVAEYALAQPAVRFTLVTDGRSAFSSPGTGDMLDVMAAVHGPPVTTEMIRVQRASDTVDVAGVVSAPSLNRPTRAAIHLSVNGRPVANRSLVFALEEAYSGYLMTGRHPVAAVQISLPPHALDANVHPSKREVRFADERAVHGAIHHAVSDALLELRAKSSPSLSDEAAESSVEDLQPGTPAALFTAEVEETRAPLAPEVPVLRIVGQTGATFIIAEGPTGVYMIDQHAAHERILFDHFEGALENGAPPVQPLLEPATVPLDSDMMLALDTNAALLQSFGFGLEPFGDSACLVRAIPSLGGRVGPVELVQEVLTELRHLPEPSAARERALAAMACKAAVKAGQTLRIEEMRELVHGLENTLRPQTCPHGRPTMIHLSHSRLEREFGRR
jgi:DNA mismatch repair protein MutL